MKQFGYVRISTVQQNIQRQIANIKAQYPKAIIIQDEYTGTKMDRPEWSKLYPALKKGDQVIFDSVSRMSRDAEEGFKVYQELYERGVELIFLKEPHINTRVFRDVAQAPQTGDKDLDETLIKGLNEYLMRLADKQIRLAFEQSQKEVDDLRQRVKEGMAVAKINGKQVGRSEGDKLTIKKAEPIKALIREYSRDFDGHNTDSEVLAILKTKTVTIPNKKRNGQIESREISAKLSRNTLYKYKKEMREGV